MQLKNIKCTYTYNETNIFLLTYVGTLQINCAPPIYVNLRSHHCPQVNANVRMYIYTYLSLGEMAIRPSGLRDVRWSAIPWPTFRGERSSRFEVRTPVNTERQRLTNYTL